MGQQPATKKKDRGITIPYPDQRNLLFPRANRAAGRRDIDGFTNRSRPITPEPGPLARRSPMSRPTAGGNIMRGGFYNLRHTATGFARWGLPYTVFLVWSSGGKAKQANFHFRLRYGVLLAFPFGGERGRGAVGSLVRSGIAGWDRGISGTRWMGKEAGIALGGSGCKAEGEGSRRQEPDTRLALLDVWYLVVNGALAISNRCLCL